jgi:GNAT superfamily N-acetyltransferase
MIDIRYGCRADMPQLMGLLDEMGRHERLPVSISQERLTADAFGPSQRVKVLVAEANGRLVGYALYYECYSSFQGPGLFLEDLFVCENYRTHRVGRELLARVAGAAQGYFGILFNVLDWNAPALGFFARAGATVLNERKTLCFGAEALRQLQQPRPHPSACRFAQHGP